MRWIPTSDPQREQAVASRLRKSSKFYRFLWEIRSELFDNEFEEMLIGCYEPRGQDPCPPAMLAMVMLLQRYEGLGDARAVDAAENDRRWQLVLGTLGDDQSPFGQGSLVRFRMRMIAHDLDKKLVDRTVELAKKSGKFGWQRLRASLDSAPLEGCGRVEDTWNLIGRAMSKVVHLVSMALGVEEHEVIRSAKLNVLKADSVKAALDIDWDDDDAQNVALRKLLSQVSRLERWVDKRVGTTERDPHLNEALEIMRKVAEQDIDPEPPEGGARIKTGVASNRIISIGDPEMRHGRKSKTKLIDGYKRHIGVVHRIILGTSVEPANLLEKEPAQKLLDSISKHGAIEILDVDRGYLSAPAVEALHREGVKVNSRPWKANKHKGCYTKEDFRIDLRRQRVTCPEGNVARIYPSGAAWFAHEDCAACRQKTRCTPSARRTVSIHRQEDLHIKLRRNRKTKPGRSELRKRVVVEHRLARVTAIQGPRARYKGARKNELDLNRAAAVVNLQEVARLRLAA